MFRGRRAARPLGDKEIAARRLEKRARLVLAQHWPFAEHLFCPRASDHDLVAIDFEVQVPGLSATSIGHTTKPREGGRELRNFCCKQARNYV